GDIMKVVPWITLGMAVGLAAGAGWLLTGKESAAQAEEAKKADAAKGPSKKETAKKPAADDELKPAPYPEDPLNSPAEKNYKGSGGYRWLNVALQATVREHERHGARPTIGSRNLAIVVTAMFDAWAAYDAKAVGTRLGGKLRRPTSERTTANKDKAIA